MVPLCSRMTAHALVAKEFGPTQTTPQLVEAAMARVMRRGYVPNWTPNPEAYHQQVVLVSTRHPLAALYRALAPDGTPTAVPRGLVESRTISPINNVIAGMLLARFGLVIMQVAGCSVTLRGSSMKLANDANISRYEQLPPEPTWKLVERAAGITTPAAQIDDDLRLQTALIYDAHGLVVDGLLDGADTCALVSRWRFPAPQAQHHTFKPPF